MINTQPTMDSQFTFRRCQPWLGTFVELAVDCVDRESSAGLFELGFAAIERVHQRLNFHDELSELRRFCLAPLHEWQDISFDLQTLLICSQEYFTLSQGAINPVIGGTPEDFQVREGQALRCKEMAIDFSGMAKGYAVDQALAALQMGGARAAMVNAGGDLGTFGKEVVVHSRRARHPQEIYSMAQVRDVSVASSADYFAARKTRNRKGELVQFEKAVAVIAKSCLKADAFTKWVLLDSPDPEYLRECGAEYLQVRD